MTPLGGIARHRVLEAQALLLETIGAGSAVYVDDNQAVGETNGAAVDVMCALAHREVASVSPLVPRILAVLVSTRGSFAVVFCRQEDTGWEGRQKKGFELCEIVHICVRERERCRYTRIRAGDAERNVESRLASRGSRLAPRGTSETSEYADTEGVRCKEGCYTLHPPPYALYILCGVEVQCHH